jgi:hypothetical protein
VVHAVREAGECEAISDTDYYTALYHAKLSISLYVKACVHSEEWKSLIAKGMVVTASIANLVVDKAAEMGYAAEERIQKIIFAYGQELLKGS